MTTAILLIALAAEAFGVPHVHATIPVVAPVADSPRATGQRAAPPKARIIKPSGRSVSGRASWHATGRDGLYAAAGPELRRWLGAGWRGSRVVVCHGGCIRVVLNDHCPCSTGSNPKLIDLSDEAYRRLARLSSGVIRVRVYRDR